ncbi:hypothetical protein J7I80_08605 [Bacillus sp. ISL-41]|uniref:hypothetical protein n=1 Tax=Bacillus sp. ISL-41 TaxID=2819127 RepID=UPI001BEC3EA8|nr:hypothetical protein [Bacillus sp. ISL-41]MBT2642283.1 hypothetical protein [Bacillus sp. ISL-41]
MKKETWTKITYSYLLLVGVAFAIYAFNVADENWNIDFEEQKNNIYIFLALSFVAVILTAVDAAGVRENSKNVGKKAIYGGLSLAALFVVWRLLVTIF